MPNTESNERCSRGWLASCPHPIAIGAILGAAISLALLTSPAAGQNNLGDPVDVFPDLALGAFGDSAEPAKFSAEYEIPEGSNEGEIRVTVDLSRGWHIFSVTQEPGGPIRTTLSIDSPDSVQVIGDFKPDQPPLKSVSSEFTGITVEEHIDTVVWNAPIRVPDGFRDQIVVFLDGQVCEEKRDPILGGSRGGGCVPLEEKITANFVAAAGQKVDQSATAKPKQKPFREKDYVVDWIATASSNLPAGGSGVLKFTATPDAQFHVYVAAVDDAQSSTNFVVTEKAGLLVGAPVTKEPVVTQVLIPSLPPTKYHKGRVTWTLPIQVPSDAAAGEHVIEGMVAYQACKDQSCLPPVAMKFKATVVVGEGKPTESAVQLVSAKARDAFDAAAETKWVDKIETAAAEPPSEEPDAAVPVAPADSVAPEKSSMPLPLALLFAFIGGVILNVMPCVLPVVGLKIMSFVQQAGEDRRRIFMLNIVYVFGILSVFAILAALAVLLSFSWGEQFTYFPVRLGLTLLLFALALSYLGVWEIPVPGMAAGKGSQQLQSREGYPGAFFKGVFATILATPCSGPLLGGILGLTIGLRPIETVIVIMTVGFGMSLPYLIIGARPSLVSWLPKPGNWMETLKEFLAFLFLGTVAFFFNQFSDGDKLPVFVALIGVWFGCWLIGKVPSWEALQKRLIAWAAGTASAAIICILAFKLLGPAELAPGEKAIPWEPYNEARLAQLQSEGRTVMVDFTAKWCVNCIVNYNVALNTEPTRQLLEELDAVPMLADWTDRSATIKKKLEELESRSIPLLAIYPGADPKKPIVLRDLVSQNAVLEALREAGESISSKSGIARQMTPAATSSSRGQVAVVH